MDKGAGVYLHKKVGDKVKKGEPLFTIYAQFKADFNFAIVASDKEASYKIKAESSYI